MIRLLEILNSLGINTLDDVDNYAESLFSELDLIRSGEDISSHSFVNFEKTGDGEYTGKIPLISWPQTYERNALSNPIQKRDQDYNNSMISNRKFSVIPIKSFLKFEDKLEVMYKIKQKGESLRSVYEKATKVVLDASNKINLLENKNKVLSDRVASSYAKLLSYQKNDLPKISASERFISEFEQIEINEIEDFISFKFHKSGPVIPGTGGNIELIPGNTVKIKVVLFEGVSETSLSTIERSLNLPTERDFHNYGLVYGLEYELYEDAIAEDPNLSYDLDYILSKIGFSSIEDLNLAMNKFSKFKQPKFSESDPRHRKPQSDSPTRILYRIFGKTEFSDIGNPGNIFENPLGIDRRLHDGLQKTNELINIEVSDSNFLFEKGGDHKEYLVEDIAAISLDSKDQSPVSRISTSHLYEIARNSEKIREESVSFAKKYISLFENLFSRRCERAISEDFSFYKNIFNENKVLSTGIESLKDFDEKEYGHEERIKLEVGAIFGILCLESKTFEEGNIEYSLEGDFKKALTDYIATYKYAKYIISSNDIYRIGLFGLSVGANRLNGSYYPIEHIIKGDLYSNIKKEVKNHLESSEDQSFNLDKIIENSIYKNIVDADEKIITATENNLNTVLDSIQNDYFITIFNCNYNFNPRINYYSNSDKKFSPNHRDFLSKSDISLSRAIEVDPDKFEKANLSDGDDASVGISNDFMIESVSGISSVLCKNYLKGIEPDINLVKLQYILKRREVIPVSGYKNIKNGVFKSKESNIYEIVASEKNISLFMDLINSKNKIINNDYADDFIKKNEKAKLIISNIIKSIPAYTVSVNINMAKYLESKLPGFDYMSDETPDIPEEGKIDKKFVNVCLNNLQKLISFGDENLRGIIDLQFRDVVHILKDLGGDMIGSIEGSKIYVPNLSFDDGRINMVPQSMLSKINSIQKGSEANPIFGISKDIFSKDDILPIYNTSDMNLHAIIFAAEHSSVEAGNYGKNNLSSFLNIFEEIIKDIMIAEEKFIASKDIKTIFDFIKDENLKNFIDFIIKSDNSDLHSLSHGRGVSFPVASETVYNYVNNFLKDKISFSALLFSKKHKFETKSDLIKNIMSISRIFSGLNTGEDFGFSIFCCNLMFESDATLPKKIDIAKNAFDIFHSDLSLDEVELSSRGICNFAINNKEFVNKNKDEAKEFFSLLENIDFMQSKEFIDNSDKAIFMKLTKSFYKIRSSFLYFKEGSFKDSIVKFLEYIFTINKNGALTDSIIENSIFFGCEEEDTKKAISELKKEDANLESVVNVLKIEKFSSLETFITLCGYSKDKAYSDNENIYIILRSIDYIAEIVTKYSSYLRYYEIAEPKNKKIFEADYNFTYKGIPFGFHVLRDLDPYHFQVGRDTNCCQVLGGFGAAAAVDSFVNSEAGVIVSYSGSVFNRENILTQSYFHIVDDGRSDENNSYFILDNIEFSRKNCEETDNILGENHNDYLQLMFASLAKHLESKGFGETLLGKSHTKISMDKFMNSSIYDDPRVFTSRYTDFSYRDHKNISKNSFSDESFFAISDGSEKTLEEKEQPSLEAPIEEGADLSEDSPFDMSEIYIFDMEYYDYSKKKEVLRKIFSDLKNKKSEKFKELKSFCKKNGLNFQKVIKIKLDFCKKSIKDIERKELINENLKNKILSIKRYLKSKAYSNITIEELYTCLEKYRENEGQMVYTHENMELTDAEIESSIDRVNNPIEGDRPTSQRQFERLYNELSKYKSGIYLLSKSNILLKYIILGSKDMIKKEFEDHDRKSQDILRSIKEDLQSIGAWENPIENPNYNKLVGSRFYHGINNAYINPSRKSKAIEAFERFISEIKDDYPNSYEIIISTYIDGVESLLENVDISIENLKIEIKNLFLEKNILNDKLTNYLEYFSSIIYYYIFKKYFKSNKPLKIYEEFSNMESLINQMFSKTDDGVKHAMLEKLNTFISLNEDIDLEELIKSAKSKNNKQILKLARWLLDNKFSNEFKKLDKLNWEI